MTMEMVHHYFDVYNFRNMLVDQVGAPWFWMSMSSASLFQAFKYLIIVMIVLAIGWHYIQKRRYVVQMINRIPGPPVSPLLPWLGHAVIVLDLDRCKFEHGTYACKYC